MTETHLKIKRIQEIIKELYHEFGELDKLLSVDDMTITAYKPLKDNSMGILKQMGDIVNSFGTADKTQENAGKK